MTPHPAAASGGCMSEQLEKEKTAMTKDMQKKTEMPDKTETPAGIEYYKMRLEEAIAFLREIYRYEEGPGRTDRPLFLNIEMFLLEHDGKERK